jgi:hypothetical protein
MTEENTSFLSACGLTVEDLPALKNLVNQYIDLHNPVSRPNDIITQDDQCDTFCQKLPFKNYKKWLSILSDETEALFRIQPIEGNETLRYKVYTTADKKDEVLQATVKHWKLYRAFAISQLMTKLDSLNSGQRKIFADVCKPFLVMDPYTSQYLDYDSDDACCELTENLTGQCIKDIDEIKKIKEKKKFLEIEEKLDEQNVLTITTCRDGGMKYTYKGLIISKKVADDLIVSGCINVETRNNRNRKKSRKKKKKKKKNK